MVLEEVKEENPQDEAEALGVAGTGDGLGHKGLADPLRLVSVPTAEESSLIEEECPVFEQDVPVVARL